MRFQTLDEWLHWQESLNPNEIELGLERVSEVLQRCALEADFFCPVITVAGTNGKGSTVAFIESLLMQTGLRVGSYTSPHLFHYSERIRIDRQAVSDMQLCEAFECVDQARGDIPLTYFEFGTLAALMVFKQLGVDVVVLEVGLGGRLDAVNVINPSVAVISSVAMDHTDWLGDSLEAIAYEKAGIMRQGRPCVVSIAQPPQSLLDHAASIGAQLIRLGSDYIYQALPNERWQLRGPHLNYSDLAFPALKGAYQLQNAAAAVMAVQALQRVTSLQTGLTPLQVQQALGEAQVNGRYQQLQTSPRVIVDVAHNEQAADMLAQNLQDEICSGKTHSVIAMLRDKDIDQVLARLCPELDSVFTAGLDVPRGQSAQNMAEAVRRGCPNVTLTACDTVEQACEAALQQCQPEDRLIISGSFYTVAAAMGWFKQRADNE